ncbi:uncharacterized protein LOC135494470 [Lineus longissimus]|uniref:uncharacterized protein LOC135494470 n=1 Tax=Lineus longissimus TaxID=88925 RepID=UPI00315D7DE5
MVQYRHAVRTLTLPHEAFNKLSQEVGDSKVPVIMFPNTGRCGSTLVSQMFEACNVQSDSEPDVTLSLTGIKRSMPREQFLKPVQSTIRLLCKPRQKVVTKIVIKLRSMGIMHCMDMAKLFPDMSFLFMYRDPLETMRSWSYSVVTRPAFYVVHSMATTPSLRPMIARLADFLEYSLFGDDEETAWMRDSRKSYEPYEYWNMHQCWIILKYKIKAIRYGDIIKDPEGAVKTLFQYCDIPTHLVAKALDAMSKDSQRGTSFSKARRDTSRTQHGEDELRIFDEYCRATGIPQYSHDGILPGTIQ